MIIYVTGCIFALLVFLFVFAFVNDDEEVHGSEVIENMIGISIMSLFSWAIVYVMAMMFVFQLIKNKRKEYQ